jgi:hypothetical protein
VKLRGILHHVGSIPTALQNSASVPRRVGHVMTIISRVKTPIGASTTKQENRMIQVKVFHGDEISDIETEVNKFFSDFKEEDIISVRHAQSDCVGTDYSESPSSQFYFSIIVIYRTKS